MDMRIKIGEVGALFRYPVKSMRGELLDGADLGWHGLAGDRRLAFRLADVRGGFPWLTASKLPELVLFSPHRQGPVVPGNLPTHVRTPDGAELTVFSQELAADVGRRHGSPVEMMHLDRGIFDEASISVMTSATVSEIGRLAAQSIDARCSMVNFDRDSARPAPQVLKAIVQVRDNKAGVYGTVTRRGRLAVGQSIFFQPVGEHRERL